MKTHSLAALERALLEYVAFYGLSIRAREIFGGDLPTTLVNERAWAMEKLEGLSAGRRARGASLIAGQAVPHPPHAYRPQLLAEQRQTELTN